METLSYHNSPELKARFIVHVEKHRKQDSLLRGTYGTMEGSKFRGCAVGCSIRSLDEIEGKPLRLDNGNHRDLAERLGIPLVLARLEDRIFEGLPVQEAMLWPTLFAQAIPIGADLSLVWPKFAHWMLVDETAGVIRFAKTDAARKAIHGIAELLKRQGDGGCVGLDEWRTARSSAYADASTYASSAYAADASAYAADASAYAYASYAADASADAAYASADASADASAYAAYAKISAREKHYRTMAEALLRFMSEAPIKA